MASAQEAYLESSVLCADPLELLRLLYQVALDSVEKARRHLRQGEIGARSREISRALAALTELVLSINQGAYPALAGNLVELYDYMQRRLIDASIRQADEPLAEVTRLLATLLDAWLHCTPSAPRQPQPYYVQTPESECAAQSWSF